MRSRLLTILFFTCLIFSAKAQSEYEDYEWESPAKLHELSDEDKELGEIILQEKRVVEYAYGSDNRLYEYTLVHMIIKVNSNEGIEKNNKVYLPLYKVEDILINKARVITSSGEVKELDEDDIKEAEDEEGKHSYKYYAIEGIDKGSEIEYIYLLKNQPYGSGEKRTFQDEVEKRNVSFEIIAPKGITMKTKSYNGFPELEEDEEFEDANSYKLAASIDKIEAVDDEDFANYDANMMHVVYKIAGARSLGSKELHTYSEMAGLAYDAYKGKRLTKKELSTAKKILKKIDIPDNGSEEDKIRAVEEYVKTNFRVVNISLEGLDDVTQIYSKKFANNRGIIKMFCAIFEQMEIDNQLVMTCDRYDQKMDKNFESYLCLNEILLYFPKSGKYLAPTEASSRLGLIPHEWTNNYGLFIRGVSLGEFKSGVGKIKFIKPLKSAATGDKSDIEMDFNDFTDSKIKIQRSLHGYYGSMYQFYYSQIDEEQSGKLTESIMEYVANDAELQDLQVSNKGAENIGVKPLIVSAAFDASQFIEKAGPKYLFKVGEVIGPQAEMYQEKERKLPVENDYNRFYKRTITFTIPDGYEVANLDDLNMNVTCGEEGKETCVFISKYTVTGNKVEVIVDEWYEQIEYPIEEFEAYRKVINAAADFNKIVLIFKKKA